MDSSHLARLQTADNNSNNDGLSAIHVKKRAAN